MAVASAAKMVLLSGSGNPVLRLYPTVPTTKMRIISVYGSSEHRLYQPLHFLWLGIQRNVIYFPLLTISSHVCNTLFTRRFLPCYTDMLSEKIQIFFVRMICKLRRLFHNQGHCYILVTLKWLSCLWQVIFVTIICNKSYVKRRNIPRSPTTWVYPTRQTAQGTIPFGPNCSRVKCGIKL